MMWEVLNRVMKKVNNKTEITSVITRDGKVSDPRAVANVFNDHFSNTGKRIQETIGASDLDPLVNVKPVATNLTVKPLTEYKLCKIVSRLEAKRSSGYDDISNFLLKHIIHTIKSPFCLLINKSIKDGIFPDCMKIAKIIPLHKSGSIEDPDNFRPISLLPVLSKILEKYMYSAVTSHLADNNVLYLRQFGFRQLHSTVHAAQLFVSEVLNSFEEDLFVASIFIDMKKAFDSVSHDLILKKLECLGIRWSPVKLVQELCY